jgi:hypothetical protein
MNFNSTRPELSAMTTLAAVSLDLTGATFFKTAAGLQEIQSRALGLPALIRRILVLVDGKRSGKELAAFVGDGANIAEVLGQLVAHGCIDAQGAAKPAPAAAAPLSAQLDEAGPLAGLPDPVLRSPREIEMARNFMIHTTNTICGQNQRLSLLKSLLACQSAGELRQVYPVWASTISTIPAGAKRLPELLERLFVVL